MFSMPNWCLALVQGTIWSWVPVGFPSLAIRPMTNGGGCLKFLRRGHAEVFSESVRGFASGLETSHTAPLVRKVVAV